MKVAIMQADSNGCFPIPASKGGAISTLVEHIIEDNSNQKQADFIIVSYYDKEAEELSKKYKNVEFVWVRVPKFIRVLDMIGYWFINTFFKKKKAVSFKSLFSLLWYIGFGTKFLKEHKVDKLVLENNIPLAMMIRNSHYDGEYYYHFHNVPRIDAHCRKVFEQCNGFLCVSKYVADQITSDKSAIGCIKKDKVRVLYNCVDTGKFRPVENNQMLDYAREKYDINENDNIVIFVGRISAEKGIEIVIDAIKNLPDVKLLVVGSYMHNAKGQDEYIKKIRELTNEIVNRVIFTGYVDQIEMPVLYSISDIAVLPSMWNEPAGLTMVEAMSCGTIVITTKVGGIPEYVGNEGVTLLRDKEIKNNIVSQVSLLLLDKNSLKNKGLTSRMRIQKNFDIKFYASRLIENLV